MLDSLRHQFRKFRAAGNRYECPFCGFRAREFLEFGLPFQVLLDKQVVGGGVRKNALCPSCNAIDRHRLLYLFLKNKTDIFQRAAKVLHVAPEPAIRERLLATGRIDYLSADLIPDGVMVQMDITQIQYPDASFDVVICNHVLGNIPDDRLAMREVSRVLRPGGWAILQVPVSYTSAKTDEDASIVDPRERERRFGEAHQIRIYGPDYVERLQSVGFKVNDFVWTREPESFGGADNRYGLNANEHVYQVFKP